jgi:hypothetical protein
MFRSNRGADQSNLCDYAANDPMNFVDPSELLFGGTVNAGARTAAG